MLTTVCTVLLSVLTGLHRAKGFAAELWWCTALTGQDSITHVCSRGSSGIDTSNMELSYFSCFTVPTEQHPFGHDTRSEMPYVRLSA